MLKKFILILFINFLFCFSCLAKSLTLVHLTDIQVDSLKADNKIRKFQDSFIRYKNAIGLINRLNPDVVVFSGDMINSPRETDFKEFMLITKEIKAPYYIALGNHDVAVGSYTKKQIMDFLSLDKRFYYVTNGDYILIFMDGTTDKKITANGYFSKIELNFLDTTLTEYKDKKAIIIQHFPIIEPFKSNSHKILNEDEYLKILDKHKNVIAVLTGHYHFSKLTIRNNVAHISSPAMIEEPFGFRYLVFKEDNSGNIIINSKVYRSELTKPNKFVEIFGNDNNFSVMLNK